MEIGRCTVFQQDNAPCHVSKMSKKRFSDNSVELLDWPGNGPDLNPIENLWQIVKNKLQTKSLNSRDNLKREISRVWYLEITKEVCENLVSSMPRRIKAVLENKGFSTKY